MNFDDFLEDCKDGYLARVQQGLSDINLKQTDSDGRTPLMLAVLFGHAGVVSVLIPGSDLRQSERWGNTALMLAARSGCMTMEAVKLLIPGSDLRQMDDDGRTALILAARGGYADVVKALIPGSDLSLKDSAGKTALETAINNRQWPCVDELAMHHPQWEKMQWPEAAGREDLPQWASRRERRALEAEAGPTGRPVASPAKPRNLRL